MTASLALRRGLIGSAAALAVLIVIAAALAAAVDAGYFRGPLLRLLARCTQRQVHIDGSIEAHIFSLHPRVTAERVVIGNPPWMPKGNTAEIAKISLVIDLPRFRHSIGIESLKMDAARLHLVRNATGHANWQMTDPDTGGGAEWPIIHLLSMQDAHVDLEDARLHLNFDGSVSAHEMSGVPRPPPLRIAAAGLLNGRAATLEITGDSLVDVARERPYHFIFVERSSGSRLIGTGSLLRPFDLTALDTTFDAAGANLKDLYYLTGVTLVNTGNYRLSGTLSRRGTHSKFSELRVTSGQSDIRGLLSIDTASGRPKLDADFTSQLLRLADLGERAAARGSEPESGTPLLLSNAMLKPSTVRRGDALVNFHARRVEVGHIPMRAVAATMTIDQGILTVSSLSAEVLEGRLTAHLKLDANRETPSAAVDLKITDLQLALLDRKGTPPPIDGLMRARVIVTGEGSSIHQVAATANGTVTAVLPHGTLRASLAELTGIDLRGLGLLIAKNAQETAVRCGVASFEAHQGTLAVKSLVVDTDHVLITGDGAVHLDTEALDLKLHGRPKSVRLIRIRTPVLVRGTLAHPSFTIQARHSVAQAAEAVTLGVVFTPLAAVLAFVDPGLAKDADCAALLAAAGQAKR